MGLDLRPGGRATLRGTIVFEGDLPDDLTVMLPPTQKPSGWASGMRAAVAEDREFVATYVDPGEWMVQVFIQASGQMIHGREEVIHGREKAEGPDEGTAAVSLHPQAIQRSLRVFRPALGPPPPERYPWGRMRP